MTTQPDLFSYAPPPPGPRPVITVTWPVPATEAAKKVEVLEAIGCKHRKELEYLNRIARHLFYENISFKKIGIAGLMCTDWVREAAGIVPDKGGNKNNFLGSLFRVRIPGKRRWRPVPIQEVGLHASKTPGSHARKIQYWALTEEVWK